jgi:hypothetical protein
MYDSHMLNSILSDLMRAFREPVRLHRLSSLLYQPNCSSRSSRTPNYVRTTIPIFASSAKTSRFTPPLFSPSITSVMVSNSMLKARTLRVSRPSALRSSVLSSSLYTLCKSGNPYYATQDQNVPAVLSSPRNQV